MSQINRGNTYNLWTVIIHVKILFYFRPWLLLLITGEVARPIRKAKPSVVCNRDRNIGSKPNVVPSLAAHKQLSVIMIKAAVHTWDAGAIRVIANSLLMDQFSYNQQLLIRLRAAVKRRYATQALERGCLLNCIINS